MANIIDFKMKQMEEEMSRFEQEISQAAGEEVFLSKSRNPDNNVNPANVVKQGKPQRYAGNSDSGHQFIPHQISHRPRPTGHQFHPVGQMGQGISNAPQHFGHNPPYMPQPVISAAPAVYASPPMKKNEPKVEPPPPVILPPVVIPERPVMPEIRPMIAHSSSASDDSSSKKKEKKNKRIVRTAGGQVWEDPSLMDWEPDDFRIFCGDLGNDVTDEVLTRAFSKYPSFVKSKVVRDKRTNKTKGFGFVSFKDPQDFIRAMREMNGKYVGSRPIKLRKSCWRDRNIEIVKKKQKEKERLGLR